MVLRSMRKKIGLVLGWLEDRAGVEVHLWDVHYLSMPTEGELKVREEGKIQGYEGLKTVVVEH